MTVKQALLTIGIAAAVASPAIAHHSFAAEYDANQPVTITGSVTRIEWTNPHSRVFIDAKDAQANIVSWTFELAPPKVLAQLGWRLTSVNVGDSITIEGARAKDGSLRANARIVTFADGRRVSAGSSGGDLPQK
jgi:uncharacterized protein DUF6152